MGLVFPMSTYWVWWGEAPHRRECCATLPALELISPIRQRAVGLTHTPRGVPSYPSASQPATQSCLRGGTVYLLWVANRTASSLAETVGDRSLTRGAA